MVFIRRSKLSRSDLNTADADLLRSSDIRDNVISDHDHALCWQIERGQTSLEECSVRFTTDLETKTLSLDLNAYELTTAFLSDANSKAAAKGPTSNCKF